MKKHAILSAILLAGSCAVIGQVSIKKDVNKAVSPNKAQQIEASRATTTEAAAQQPANSAPVNKAVLQPAAGVKIREQVGTKPTYDFTNVRICVDRGTGQQVPPRQEPNYPTPPAINSDGTISNVGVSRGALSWDTKKMWPTEAVITVAFAPNEATDFVQNKVMQFAKMWETYANVRFNFTPDYHNAMVKIRFVKGDGSWSWLGREVLNNPFGNATMNFGWFDNSTSDEEFRRVVMHEFGHTLGFVHEHQTAGANINWDVPKAYAFFGGPPNNWSQQQVDANIFAKYNATSINGSQYDPSSIMHYFFPSGLTLDNTAFTWNTQLSPTDIQFAKISYPFPPKPSNASGTLHTGDDCDAIDFTVEYNASGVASNTIEFTMQPGIDNHGNRVSWWKQIGIPTIGGGEDRSLQMLQDGSMVKATFLRSIIDETRGISFAKAKVLGVHTGLAFNWKVWSALPGGCRVRFVWRIDHCY